MGFFSTLKNRARQPVMAPSLPMAMPVDAKQMQQFTKPQGLPPIGPIDRPLSPSIVRPSELPATPPRPIPFGPGHPLFDPPRGGRRGGIGMPRPKKIKTDKGLGSIQKFFDRQRLGNIPMQDVPAAPVPFEMDRVPFERPGFAEGEEVSSNVLGQFSEELPLTNYIMSLSNPKQSELLRNLIGVSGVVVGSMESIPMLIKRLVSTGSLKSPEAQAVIKESMDINRPGFAEGEDVDINRIIAEQGARESISPAERKAQSIKNFLLESNRIISDRDAELYGMGLLSFEDVMRKAESARQTDLANEQRRNAIADQGRTLSMMDRNLMQQEQMFFPKEEKSFRDFQRAFKGTRLGDVLSYLPDQMQVADYMNYKREQGSLDDLLDDLEKKN